MSQELSKIHQSSKKRRKNKSFAVTKKTLLVSSSIIVLIVAGFIIYKNLNKAVENTESLSNGTTPANFEEEQSTSGEIANFTGQDFRDLYNNFAYPNTKFISEDAVIFSDPDVDAHIRKVAEARGYERRSAPVQDTFVEVEPGMSLQERAAEPWKSLKSSAKKDNIDLFLTAAYRSASDQRKIFIERLNAINLTEDLIATKQFDDKLNEILATTAIPGYSRHHTGYTIDIGCGNSPDVEFEFTVCYQWLSNENYKNAKLAGWIPSYPEKGGLQGPEPETWEYVWVGEEAVRE